MLFWGNLRQIKEHISWKASFDMKKKFFDSFALVFIRLHSSSDLSSLVYIRLNSSALV